MNQQNFFGRVRNAPYFGYADLPAVRRAGWYQTKVRRPRVRLAIVFAFAANGKFDGPQCSDVAQVWTAGTGRPSIYLCRDWTMLRCLRWLFGAQTDRGAPA
ncbi:hypothetical protein [Tranquillimonas alkanivorans]|uniref:hypothetical protein n=1 Tax=Tranquillimonas alkanivorans TaxID=441119 RepID=UPI001160A111|nr:hypothetical protein [Tranquillimonas alkanivorans]